VVEIDKKFRFLFGGAHSLFAWWGSIFVATTVLLFSSTTVFAASGNVAIYVEGPGGDAVRDEISASIPGGVQKLPPSKLQDGLAGEGVRGLAGYFGSVKQRHVLVGKVHKVESAIGADAVVLGVVKPSKKKGDREVDVMVVLATQEDPAVQETLPLPKTQKASQRATQWKNLIGGSLQDLSSSTSAAAAAAPAAKEKPKPKKSDDADEGKPASDSEEAKPEAAAGENQENTKKSSGDSAAVTPTTALASGFIGLDFGGRQFHYNQPISTATLRPYDLPASVLFPIVPGVSGAVELFPLAKGEGVLRDIGVAGSATYNVVQSKVDTQSVTTTWYSFEADLRGRIHTGKRGSSPMIGLEGGFGQLFFGFKNAGAIGATLPGVNYRFLRLGADARFPGDKFSVIVGAGYRSLLSTSSGGHTEPAAGAIADRFPHTTVGGLDAKIGAAVPLTSGLELRLIVNYTRFWFKFNPDVYDANGLPNPYVAGGALDQFVNADLGIAAFF
jgi:hypothetical protein